MEEKIKQLEKAAEIIQELLNQIPTSNLSQLKMLEKYLFLVEKKIYDYKYKVPVVRQNANDVSREFPTIAHEINTMLEKRGVKIKEIL